MKKITKSWIAVDGRLKRINFNGRNDFRFPEEVAGYVLNTYSKQGDWVIDPFAGFGTTVHVAQKLKRKAIGFEIDKDRADFASWGLLKESSVINTAVENLNSKDLPKFDLLFTSPPYITVHLKDDPWGKSYFKDMKNIFKKLKTTLKNDAYIVVEVSNIRTVDGVRPLAWQLGEVLGKIFEFQGEVIRCNISKTQAGPGFDHSYLLVYKNKQ